MAKLVKRVSMPAMTNSNNNHENIQEFIKKQIYFVGFKEGVTVGKNDIPLQLGGTARRLYGIALYIQANQVATNDDTFSLTINNEVIIQNVNWRAFNPTQNGNIKYNQYFDIPRPLSGNDSVKLQFSASVAMNIYPIFYLSEVA